MKVQKLENLENKIGLTGCKWSSLNAGSTKTPIFYSFSHSSLLPSPQISLLRYTANGGANPRSLLGTNFTKTIGRKLGRKEENEINEMKENGVCGTFLLCIPIMNHELFTSYDHAF